MKIRPVEAELFHLNGRMERHDEGKLIFQILQARIKIIEAIPLLLLYAFHNVHRVISPSF
jgi:hypothetical protein